ncbi:AbrB/MazE/SpoVT family DNA-binding domain-containing protein [Benzoatithermus flavus]|uniref:AbrB/MazE/SpoVT family DNA-binding domain-containing protein n=1 Tax=Benzoatithermus flavus TaxID=3108223 RepID=A0ABU8XSH3_9PROT
MGHQRLKLGENGRISIPAAYRKELGLEPGDELILRVDEGELRITSAKLALERARRLIARYVPAEDDLAQSLIDDRRAEAARE